MATSQYLLHVLASSLLIQNCRSFVPVGYILNVGVECGEKNGTSARVKVSTDVPYPNVNAKCLDGKTHSFFTEDHINFVLPVFFNSVQNKCVFQTDVTTGMHKVAVFVQWGTQDQQLQMHTERYWVSCVYDGHGNGSSSHKEIVESIIAPQEIQTHLGNRSTSGFTLRMTDILGGDLIQPVDIGKLVKLIATSDGSGGEAGLRAVSCDALGTNSSSRFAILRAGCGDGMILGKDAGFLTTGRVSTSPYFPSFRLFGDKNVQMDCNFTLCKTNCDGSSCHTATVKRSSQVPTLDSTQIVTISSRLITLKKETNTKSRVVEITLHGLNNCATEAHLPWQVLFIAVVIVLIVVGLGRAWIKTLDGDKNVEQIFTIMSRK